MDQQALDLYKFLKTNCDEKIMVCSTRLNDEIKRYLLVVKTGSDTAADFAINDRLWYDYKHIFEKEDPWEILYKGK